MTSRSSTVPQMPPQQRLKSTKSSLILCWSGAATRKHLEGTRSRYRADDSNLRRAQWSRTHLAFTVKKLISSTIRLLRRGHGTTPIHTHGNEIDEKICATPVKAGDTVVRRAANVWIASHVQWRDRTLRKSWLVEADGKIDEPTKVHLRRLVERIFSATSTIPSMEGQDLQKHVRDSDGNNLASQ